MEAFKKEDSQFRAYHIWITLHGMVTLNNRNILNELEQTPEKLITRMTKELMAPFHRDLTTPTHQNGKKNNEN
jgi:hypothetical protein